MGKQSRLKKERRAQRAAKDLYAQQVGLMDRATEIPEDMTVSYLLTKFIGKSGYNYISIGRYGSLFTNEKSTDIVPIVMHRAFPTTSVRGRFNDPLKRDIVELAVHVPANFIGFVVDKHANVYIAGKSEPASIEEAKSAMIALKKVTKEEFDTAVALEKDILSAELQKLQSDVKEATEKGTAAINDAEAKLKAQEEAEAKEALEDAKSNDAVPVGKTEGTFEQEAIAEEQAKQEEVIIPEVVDTPAEPTAVVAPDVQDAEVIQ